MSTDKKTTIHISFNPADNNMDKVILDYIEDNEKRYPLPKAARLKFLLHEMIVNSGNVNNYNTSQPLESKYNSDIIENKINIANEKLDKILSQLESVNKNDLDKDIMVKKQNDFLSGIMETD